ncbi:MAG: hypothetical protein FJ149_12575 [Euryarchaeota archaeon]|nr:hypothetical protein [Euryarchaeota archaeon]
MAKETAGASEDHRWLVLQNLAPYKGKWIAIAHKSIIASGFSLKTVLQEARRKGVEPLCVQVSDVNIVGSCNPGSRQKYNNALRAYL